MIKSFFLNIKKNWKSGITVSLVSIPLSVSLGVASQSTPIASIITAIWSGLIASVFGGSNYNIVGPTGALSGILASFAITYGASQLAILAILSGILIILAYVFRLEKFLVFIPASTIQGFTLGVAFIIALNQLNFAFGLQNLKKHESFIQNLIESIIHINAFSTIALIMFLLFLSGLFLIVKYSPNIPGAIILSPIGIIIGYLSQQKIIPITVQTLGSVYPNIQGSLFIFPEFNLSFLSWSIISTACTVAIISILETMISAKIADGMTNTKHKPRKEILALGLANIGSGLFGGIPATAALARTSLNIKSGATNKMSATISSISIGIISIAFLSYFSFIPLPVIASILVFTAIRMVEIHHIKNLWNFDKRNFWIAIFVAGACIIEDPIIGILLGTSVSLLIFMYEMSKGSHNIGKNINKNILAYNDKETLIYSINGPFVYVNAQAHQSRFEDNIDEYKNIILRMREVFFIDIDGIFVFDEIIESIKKQNKNVIISGLQKNVEKQLEKASKQYKRLKKDNFICEDTESAVSMLKNRT